MIHDALRFDKKFTPAVGGVVALHINSKQFVKNENPAEPMLVTDAGRSTLVHAVKY